MSLIKFNTESFIAALEPGLSSFIVQQFKAKLESKLNSIIEETYAELEKELPEKIKGKVETFFDHRMDGQRVHIQVDLTGFTKEKQR